MPKLDTVTSMVAGTLEVVGLVLAIHSFAQLRPDLFLYANVTDDPNQHWALLPYTAGFASGAAVLLGNAALFDLWHPLVRGHGSGVSKFVSVPVTFLKIASVLAVAAWATPSVLISIFFSTAVLQNSSSHVDLCSIADSQCRRMSSVAVEACATFVLVVVCIAAHCCGSCRFCPTFSGSSSRGRVKFTDGMIKSSTGPLKNFGWLWALTLGLAAMVTQLLLAWMATDDDLDVNASAATPAEGQTWTEIPWVVRGLALGSTALILFAILCDIMGVALNVDRVQKLATNRVSTAAWILKGFALVTSLLCAVCVSIDYSGWDNMDCATRDDECERATLATMLAWISTLLMNLCLVASWLHGQHLLFRRQTEAQNIRRDPGSDTLQVEDMYSELRDDDELDLDGNMILNSSSIIDPHQDIITVGTDGRIYTGARV